MQKKTILITGINGEIGHSLVEEISKNSSHHIIGVDLQPIQESVKKYCTATFTGDITSPEIIKELLSYDINEIYHLAAILSTTAEKKPMLAHQVNAGGTIGLLEMAQTIGKRINSPVIFIFPSTIAIYGIPTPEEKYAAMKITEEQFLLPRTIYGASKLYCENLGKYFSDYYMQLSETKESGYVDFRAVRFPGLISAFTVPSGGTSDYAPEMLHAAAQNKPYACFVHSGAQLPFMAMPDAVDALLNLAAGKRSLLSRHSYNVTAFAPTAQEFATMIKNAYPSAVITFEPQVKRQTIVESWPADLDDSLATADWGWKPKYSFEKAFAEYLLPNILRRYLQ